MASTSTIQEPALRKFLKKEDNVPANDDRSAPHLMGDELEDWDYHTRHYLRLARY